MGFITTYGDKTSSNSTSYPDYITELMKKGYGALGGASDGLLGGITGYTGGVAPWNGNQQGAFDASGGILSGNKDWSNQIAGSGQLSPGDLQPFENQYAKDVGDDTIKALTDSYNNRDADAAARAASGVAFGGSGSALALERGQNARHEAQDKSAAMHGVLSDSFNTAANLAEGNASRSQSGLIGADNASTNSQSRILDAINNMLATGGAKQSYDQSVTDMPWTNFSRFMGMLPGAPTTQTQDDPQTIDWLSILGSLGAKAFGL